MHHTGLRLCANRKKAEADLRQEARHEGSLHQGRARIDPAGVPTCTRLHPPQQQ